MAMFISPTLTVSPKIPLGKQKRRHICRRFYYLELGKIKERER